MTLDVSLSLTTAYYGTERSSCLAARHRRGGGRAPQRFGIPVRGEHACPRFLGREVGHDMSSAAKIHHEPKAISVLRTAPHILQR